MSVLASRAARYPDLSRDVLLRDISDGAEAVTEMAVMEAGVLINERFRGGIVETVVHVTNLATGGGDVWLDLLSLPRQHSRGDLGRVLVRVALLEPGQFSVSFDAATIPAEHLAIACRLLMLGSATPADCAYGCWLVGVRP